MSKFPHQEKIKKLKPSLLLCHWVDLDYTAQKIIHTLTERTPAKMSGNAEFLCRAARAQSNIKDILSRNIPYINNDPATQSPVLMPAGRSWQGRAGVGLWSCRRGCEVRTVRVLGCQRKSLTAQRTPKSLCVCIRRCMCVGGFLSLGA